MKKIIFVLALGCMLSFTPTKNVHAGAWGEVIMSINYKLIVEEIRAILYELGNVALEMLTTRSVVNYIGKISGGDQPAFINDYREYLVGEALDESKVFAEAFLTSNLRGRTPGNFEQSDGSDTLKSYDAVLVDAGKSAIPGSKKNQTGADYEDHCLMLNGQPIVFGPAEKPDFSCFTSIFKNTKNHPEGMKIVVAGVFAQHLEELKKEREVKATNNGGALDQRTPDGDIIKPAFISKKLLESSTVEVFNQIASYEIKHPVAQKILQRALPKIQKLAEKKIREEAKRLRKKGYEELQRVEQDLNRNNPGSQTNGGLQGR